MARTRRNGVYAPLSSTYYLDDAVIEAGPDAELLFARSLAFCAGVPSDGYFTDGQLRRFAAGLSRLNKRIEALVTAGLWVRVAGGYEIRNWLKWNKSAAEREREKSKDRERKAAQSPSGFQPELGSESEGIPDGKGVGIPTRARAQAHADAVLQRNAEQSSRSRTEPPEQPAETHDDHDDHQRQADQLIDDTGPWTPAVREALTPHVLDALPDFEPAGIKAALADYRSRLGDPKTRPGLLPHLIQQHASRIQPAKPARPDWCGNCEEETRLVLDDNRDPVGPCPDCSSRTRDVAGPVTTGSGATVVVGTTRRKEGTE